MAPLDMPPSMRPVARHHHSSGAQIGCPAHLGNDPRYAPRPRGHAEGTTERYFEPGLFKSEASRVAAGKYAMVDLLTFVDDINPIG